MSELRRMAYLEALGVDSYISRAQLPGAAVTRRLAIVSPASSGAPEPAQSPAKAPDILGELRGAVSPEPAGRAAARDTTTSVPSANAPARPRAPEAPRLSLAVIASGAWLWLEDLNGMPLRSEQVWLVESMATALLVASGSDTGPDPRLPASIKASVMQFDWPMHNNPQLDASAEAARASLGGFLERQQLQHRPQGVILLGASCTQWVDSACVSVPCIATQSSLAMLAEPALKQKAWRDLCSLLGR